MNRRSFLCTSALAVAGSSVITDWTNPLLASPIPRSRQFYVDSVGGNDNAQGISAETAWRSLLMLNSVSFQPGDRIYFKRGSDLAGQFRPQGSGAVGRPIVVDSYGSGDLPHIHCDGKAQASLYLHNLDYWIVRNLQISNHGAQAQGGRAGVYVHHEDFNIIHSITLDRLWVRDVNGLPNKAQGGGAGILINTVGNTRYEGMQITNCTIANTQRNGIHFLAAGNRKTGLGRNIVVRGNKVQKVPGDCILVIGCDGALIEHNVVSECSPLPQHEAAAGIWPFNCDNTIIQYNEVSGHQALADGEAFDSDLACNNTIIQYNYSHDNVGGLALICNLGGKNLGAGNTGTVVRYNVSINDAVRPSGAALVRITGPVDHSQIYNNIFIVPRKLSGGPSPAFKTSDWRGMPNSTSIHDNILISNEAPPVEMTLDAQSSFKSNTVYCCLAAHSSEGMVFAAPPETPSSKHVLETYKSYRPTLAEAVDLVKRCFAEGRVAPRAYQRIAEVAKLL